MTSTELTVHTSTIKLQSTLWFKDTFYQLFSIATLVNTMILIKNWFLKTDVLGDLDVLSV